MGERILDAMAHRRIGNLVLDTPPVKGKERVGYPTQKPLALLDRDARASVDRRVKRLDKEIERLERQYRKALDSSAALSAKDDLSEFHQGLRARGKRGKVALTAVMRKLLLLLNAIARRGAPWEARPQRA